MKEKLTNWLTTVFGYGIMLTLFAGGLSFFGYLAAVFIGGETAEAICTFLYKQYLPIIFVGTALLILLGLLRMYLCGERVFVPEKRKKAKGDETHG